MSDCHNFFARCERRAFQLRTSNDHKIVKTLPRAVDTLARPPGKIGKHLGARPASHQS